MDTYFNLNEVLETMVSFKEEIQGIISNNMNTSEMESIIYDNLKGIANKEVTSDIYKHKFYNSLELDFIKSNVKDRHGVVLSTQWGNFDEKSFIDFRDTELVDYVNIYVNKNEEIKKQNIILKKTKDELRGRLYKWV